MFKLAKPFFLICETALHAGSGSDLGVVDLPIQRERHTDFPKIESSSLKGGLREAFENPNEPKVIEIGMQKILSDISDAANKKVYETAIRLAFGPESTGDSGHAGALGFTDARLLLFPVKSMRGIFAWVTCPMALKRFEDDLNLCGVKLGLDLPKPNTAPKGCQILINGKAALEEYVFSIKEDSAENDSCTQLARWLSLCLFPATSGEQQADPFGYWREKLKTGILVLADDDFRDFITLSTEVATRTKIDEKTGTVQRGALFTEEYLPTESVLYSLALATPIFKKDNEEKGVFHQGGGGLMKPEEELVMEFFANGVPDMIQLGANATIGKGLVRLNVLEVKEDA